LKKGGEKTYKVGKFVNILNAFLFEFDKFVEDIFSETHLKGRFLSTCKYEK